MKSLSTALILAGLLVAGSTLACGKSDSDKSAAKANKTSESHDEDDKGATAAKTVAIDKNPAPEDKKLADKASGDGYAVKIVRPVPVGFKYRLVTTGQSDMRVTADGNPLPQSRFFSWDYEAEVTVKAVSKTGQATSEEHKVVKFLAGEGDQAPAAVQAAVILATMEAGEEVYLIDGKKVDEPLQGVLEAITDLDDGNPVDDDAVFGATTAKMVGDTWEVNKQAWTDQWAGKFEGSSLPIKAANVTGDVTLVEAKTVDGIAALSYTFAVSLKDAAPPMGSVQATSGSFDLTMERWLPADPESIQGSRGAKKLVIRTQGQVVDAGKTIELALDATVEGTRKIVALE